MLDSTELYIFSDMEYRYEHILRNIIKVLVVTKSLCGCVSNQVQYKSLKEYILIE